jgi:flagellar biosynthetic protein FlhB
MQEDDSGQEKTEEPTQKRLDKAEEDGHTLRSQEFTIAFLLLGCLIVLLNLGANFVSSLLNVYRFNLDLARPAETGQMQDHVRYSLDLIAGDLLLFLLCSIVLALLSNLLLGGLKFNPGAAGFKFDRLNPLNGLKRIFSSHSLYELAKSILKTVLILGVTVAVFWFYMDELFLLGLLPMDLAVYESGELLGVGVLLISLTLVLIAALDLPVKIREYKQKLMMTRQEVRDEFKESEGRPEVRRRIRERQREIALNKMMKAIESADVVVTNPEHFAIALSYSPGSSGAPKVLGKGADFIALQIRKRAEELEIPIFESPALARALYFTTRVDDEIPEGLYHAVAEVIAYVFNLTSLVRLGRVPQRPRPTVPDDLLFDQDGNRLKEGS